ncbi:hypothetical protein WAF17_08285 [Bernardetia sp. ABR2-2B]
MLIYLLFFIIGFTMLFSFFKGLEFISRYKVSKKKKSKREKQVIL